MQIAAQDLDVVLVSLALLERTGMVDSITARGEPGRYRVLTKSLPWALP